MATNPLSYYGPVQRNYDAALAKVLEQAALDIQDRINKLKYKPGIGAEVRGNQLRLVLNEIRNVQQAMWARGVITTVVRGQKEAKEAAVRAQEALERGMYAALPDAVADALRGSLRATAQAGIEADSVRVPRTLSSRVYNDFQLTSGVVEKTIRAGIVSGLSAKELAADVYKYISPSVPGGASYAAMRLARTEINNAFHEQQIANGRRPGVEAVKWNLSGSHRRPDACNRYADADNGMGSGYYSVDNVPGKPHPQCLCFLTYKTMSQADFGKALKAGKFDDELDARIRANLERVGQRTASTSTKAATTKPDRPLKAVPSPPVVGLDPKLKSKIGKMVERTLPRRDVVVRELERQAEIIPESMGRMNAVRRYNKAEVDEINQHFGTGVLGGYRADNASLNFMPEVLSKAYQRAFAKDVRSGWFSKCSHDHEDSGLENFVAHECGHHVEAMMNRMGPQGTRAVWDKIADAFGLKRPGIYQQSFLDTWVQRRPDIFSREVSEYGAQESGELLAEIWAEYTTNPNARPKIKLIGDAMKELAERNAAL